jgi:hypothetical protein
MGPALRGGCAALALLLVWCTTISAHNPTPADLLVGRWQASEHLADGELALRMEFTRDSVRINIGGAGATVSGPYHWIDAQTIEVAVRDPDNRVQTERSTIQVSDKELTVTGRDGHPVTFTRVK